MTSIIQLDLSDVGEWFMLLLKIFTGGHHRSLSSGLRCIRKDGKVALSDVMEASFMHSKSLDEYARPCGRSLSSFKADFLAI